MTTGEFSSEVLQLDAEKETARICNRLRAILGTDLKRRGLVVGVSGGIDSAVTLALAVRSLGAERVLALIMPESQSAPETLGLSNLVTGALKAPFIHVDISDILAATGCYRLYDAAVRSVVPEFTEKWKSKIVMPNITENEGYTVFSIVVQSPEGTIIRKRLGLDAYLEIVAATNFKQRVRTMLEYYHADRLNFAVAGTPNRLEFDQGFFVKQGDGMADVKPIAHLYKTQVYALAEYLGIPPEIRCRPPTTDTYPLPQSQEEFFFSLPYHRMDLCLYGSNNNVDPAAVGKATGLTLKQVERVYQDIEIKRSTTRYLHLPPVLTGDVPEIAGTLCGSP